MLCEIVERETLFCVVDASSYTTCIFRRSSIHQRSRRPRGPWPLSCAPTKLGPVLAKLRASWRQPAPRRRPRVTALASNLSTSLPLQQQTLMETPDVGSQVRIQTYALDLGIPYPLAAPQRSSICVCTATQEIRSNLCRHRLRVQRRHDCARVQP